MFDFKGRSLFILWVSLGAFGLFSTPASAIPSFARQMAVPCSTCHTVFPSLTAFGRQFKLRGYTLGNALDDKLFPENLPLAFGMQVANTSVKNRSRGADPDEDFQQANKTIVQQVALYYGGKVAGKVGAFAQYNWDGIEKKWGAEMVDIRYADSATVGGKELAYGVTVSNSPGMADLWNSNPMWSFPHLDTAGVMPMQTSLFDMDALANQVGNVGLYGFYDSQYFLQLGFLRNGQKGIFRALNLNDGPVENAIKGNAPHVRMAWEKTWGPGTFEIGMHYLRADIYPEADNQNGPTNRYTDVALDSQYQYDGGDHMFSLHAFLGREKRSWDASFPAGDASNRADNLTTVKLNGHYFYQRKLGGGIGFFDYHGDTDRARYGMGGMGMASAMGNARGSPDTRGWMIEANWLPLENRQNVKLGLRYTAYSKFNGASSNYNGAGRDASDNNSVFGYAWILF